MATSLTQDDQTLLFQALSDKAQRVRPLILSAGQKVWLKQVENLSLRLKLQKGSAAAAFLRERNGLHIMGRLGLPVAPILAEGEDWFMTPDLGLTLRRLMWHPTDDNTAAFKAGALALAKLHLAGHRHGRPAIRDICWDGNAARFIDLERFKPGKASLNARAVDLIIFVHSLYADALNPGSASARANRDTALATYRRAAPDIWARAAQIASWLRWLAPLARLAGSGREMRAIAPTLAVLRARQG
jgi:tRNA A-37 threonylcarbamoyl transferase component Bud32